MLVPARDIPYNSDHCGRPAERQSRRGRSRRERTVPELTQSGLERILVNSDLALRNRPRAIVTFRPIGPPGCTSSTSTAPATVRDSNSPALRLATAVRRLDLERVVAFTRYSTILLFLTTASKFLIQIDLICSTVLPASATARCAASSQLFSDCEITSITLWMAIGPPVLQQRNVPLTLALCCCS